MQAPMTSLSKTSRNHSLLKKNDTLRNNYFPTKVVESPPS